MLQAISRPTLNYFHYLHPVQGKWDKLSMQRISTYLGGGKAAYIIGGRGEVGLGGGAIS